MSIIRVSENTQAVFNQEVTPGEGSCSFQHPTETDCICHFSATYTYFYGGKKLPATSQGMHTQPPGDTPEIWLSSSWDQ